MASMKKSKRPAFLEMIIVSIKFLRGILIFLFLQFLLQVEKNETEYQKKAVH